MLFLELHTAYMIILVGCYPAERPKKHLALAQKKQVRPILLADLTKPIRENK